MIFASLAVPAGIVAALDLPARAGEVDVVVQHRTQPGKVTRLPGVEVGRGRSRAVLITRSFPSSPCLPAVPLRPARLESRDRFIASGSVSIANGRAGDSGRAGSGFR